MSEDLPEATAPEESEPDYGDPFAERDRGRPDAVECDGADHAERAVVE